MKTIFLPPFAAVLLAVSAVAVADFKRLRVFFGERNGGELQKNRESRARHL